MRQLIRYVLFLRWTQITHFVVITEPIRDIARLQVACGAKGGCVAGEMDMDWVTGQIVFRWPDAVMRRRGIMAVLIGSQQRAVWKGLVQ